MKGFVIDTNKYSGNFERQLCAFITGHVGDCGVGENEAEDYLHDFEEEMANITSVADEYGCHRPCAIYPTVGVWNNGMGFYYKDGEEEIALEKHKQAMRSTKEGYIRMYQGYYEPLARGWTVEKLDKVIAELREDIAKAEANTEVGKYPAYQSVIIYFHGKPSVEQVEIMKERAYTFAAQGREAGLKITGFRWIETVVVEGDI